MSLVDNIAAQPDPGSQLDGSITKGLDAGVAFAAAQQKADLMGQQMDDLKQHQKMKQNDYILDAFDKASKAKNPQVRKLILDSADKTQQSWGNPAFNPDTMKLMATDSGSQNMSAILGKLNSGSQASDIGDAADQLVKAGYATPQEAIGIAGKVHDSLVAAESKADLASYRGDALESKTNALNQAASNFQNTKTSQAFKNTQTLLEGSRNTPDVNQAYKDLYAAKKADSLVDNYPDPDKIPMPMVKLYTSELGKIASGGVPTQHELDGLTPNALSGPLSEQYSRFIGKPTPANLGAFIKSYQTYTHTLASDAKEVIDNKVTRVLEAGKPHLSPGDYATLKAQYDPSTYTKLGGSKAVDAATQQSPMKTLQASDLQTAAKTGATYQSLVASAQKRGYAPPDKKAWIAAGGTP